MGQKKFLILLSALLVLASCTEPQQPIVQTKLIERDIAVVGRPAPVNLSDPRFYVVNKDNLDEFLEKFEATNNTTVFVALSVRDYEKLALNVAELKRYIEQQDEIIVYYENSVR